MRAAVFKGVGQRLAIEVFPDPNPGPEQVVIKIHRCGICGTDLHVTDGHFAEPVAVGTVLGHEYSGEVVAVGKLVEGLKTGDRVAAMPLVGCGKCQNCLAGNPVWCEKVQPNFGGFGELVATGAGSCVKLPAGLSFADGALVEPLSVSLHGVLQAGVLLGKRVLIMGGGPIGLGALFWSRRMGAAHVTVVEGVPARAELARAMGADLVLTPAPKNSEQTVVDTVGGAVSDDLPEVVFECVGKPGMLAQAIAFVRPKGAIISLGFCMVTDQLVPAAAAAKELSLRFPVAWTLRDFHTSMDAFDSGAADPRVMLTRTVSLAEAPDAFEELRAGSVHGKVHIAPASAVL